MLRNIDMNKLKAVKKRSPEAAKIIDQLLANHKEVIGSIGHELRNPLALIYSGLQLIQDDHPEVKDFKFWRSTFESTEEMALMMRDLTEFNNSENLKLEKVRMGPFLRNVAISFSIAMEPQGIYFWSDIPDRLPSIQADPMKLKRVLYNLLRNSRDAVYAHLYGDPCEISMVVRRAVVDGYRVLIIEIEDNGCGIHPDHLDLVFKPFVSFKTNGSGLGLPICKNIIEGHKGTIAFESELKKGTKFTITLPV